MHQLIKYFANEDYAKQFLSGKLYMNSISHFWNNGFESQMDIFEGVSETIDKTKFGLLVYWQQILDGDILFQLNAYAYCNLLCFYRVDMMPGAAPDPLGKPYALPGSCTIHVPSENMKEFGTTVAIIHDERAFVDRVLQALEPGWLCVAGDVRYHGVKGRRGGRPGNAVFKAQGDFDAARYARPGTVSSRRDCFNKQEQYDFQREWRICLFRNVKDTDSYVLNVGGLSDIVELVPSDRIQERLLHLHAPCVPGIVPPQYSGYRGNITRNGFKEKLYAFDGGMGSIFMVM